MTPWTEARQASLSFTTSQSLLKLMFIELVMPYNHLILCHPSSPSAFNLSQNQSLFQWVCYFPQAVKVLELQLQHHSSEYLELISMAHLLKNPLAIQETWVQSLGWEDPLEKRKTTHSSILAWRIPWLYSPCGRKESESTEWLALLLSISFRIDWSDFLAVQGTPKSFL